MTKLWLTRQEKRRGYEGGWKDDIQATVEAILMWPLIFFVLIRGR
jgi:hypothetical protein